jgi:hypothetical protein
LDPCGFPVYPPVFVTGLFHLVRCQDTHNVARLGIVSDPGSNSRSGGYCVEVSARCDDAEHQWILPRRTSHPRFDL